MESERPHPVYMVVVWTAVACTTVLSIVSTFVLLMFVLVPFLLSFVRCQSNLVSQIAIGSNDIAIIQCVDRQPSRMFLENDNKRGMIYAAMKSGRSELVGALLRRGAEPNGRFIELGNAGLQWVDGYNPLHLAVSQENVKMVALLLQFGADPIAHGPEGENPLDLGRRLGNSHVLTLLERAASVR